MWQIPIARVYQEHVCELKWVRPGGTGGRVEPGFLPLPQFSRPRGRQLAMALSLVVAAWLLEALPERKIKWEIKLGKYVGKVRT